MNTEELTIDEAIKHCREIADKSCSKCGNEHLILATWLQELRERRENEILLLECAFRSGMNAGYGIEHSKIDEEENDAWSNFLADWRKKEHGRHYHDTERNK